MKASVSGVDERWNLEHGEDLLSASVPDDPRGTLSARGIPVDEERLVRAIQAGDGDTARLLLAAGADASDLSRAVSDRGRRKDLWEKLGTLSGLLTSTSSLVIAGVGWYFTRSYNDRQIESQQSQSRQQNRLVEMQTLERLIPHLIKDEARKRAALIAINELASPTLAIRLGAAFGGTGAVQALGSIASQGGSSASEAVSGLAGIAIRGGAEERAAVERALGQVFASARDSVVTVFVDGGPRCTGFVVSAERATVLTAEYYVPREARSLQAGSEQRRLPASVVSRNAYPGMTTAVDVDAKSMAEVMEGISAKGLVEVRFDDSSGEPGGSGGGPILDATGSVVCMVYLGNATREYCVPAVRLRASAGLAGD